MRHYMKERELVMGRVGRTRENPDVPENPWMMRGLKRTVPSSVSSTIHKYRRNNFNPSQGLYTVSCPSNQQQIRKFSLTTEESRQGARVQSDKARETRTTGSKGDSAAEGRPCRSVRTTTVSPCPYYVRNKFKCLKEYQRSRRVLRSTIYRRKASGDGTSAWKP
ncbi:uncharacterized protein TNCV_812601 [Trichonephila clavipes]|nr:uncharacterized protein TNCV_812601 [Trichonephila clavipes]